MQHVPALPASGIRPMKVVPILKAGGTRPTADDIFKRANSHAFDASIGPFARLLVTDWAT
jgi:hypothetical protein